MEAFLFMLLCLLVTVALYFLLGVAYLRLMYGEAIPTFKSAVLYIFQDIIEHYEQIFERD
jgi:biotin transporter BioY